MPRHHRNASGAHHHYANPLPDAMASTSLYAQQPQRMQLPSNYYAVPPAPDADSLRFSDPQQASFEACARIPSTLPPSTQHRPSSGAWTVQDDNQLITARMQGLNWSQIKDAYFPAKSANACRKRHERLMERRGTDDWDTRKLQHLAKEYMSMRKEIWSGLAARTGEKWNVVEAKVCIVFGPLFHTQLLPILCTHTILLIPAHAVNTRLKAHFSFLLVHVEWFKESTECGSGSFAPRSP